MAAPKHNLAKTVLIGHVETAEFTSPLSRHHIRPQTEAYVIRVHLHLEYEFLQLRPNR